jgi:enoyl-[acyl-carrier protein] reductase I
MAFVFTLGALGIVSGGRSAYRAAPARVARAGPQMALPIDLTGKTAFVAGVADSSGYGWAICKALAEAGATITVGTWPPVLGIFEKSLTSGKFDEDMTLSDGSKMVISKVYPLDAVFDTPDDVPEDVKANKRYAGLSGYTVSEAAKKVEADYGKIDILVHSLANGPEVTKPLLETSRKGYVRAPPAARPTRQRPAPGQRVPGS